MIDGVVVDVHTPPEAWIDVRVAHEGPSIERHAPMLGEDFRELLQEPRYAPEAIRDFVAAGLTGASASGG
jgi:crotonobetainyl-CoA:carnitine CoA-transferase CaiB-like acyl-CoA transferase